RFEQAPRIDAIEQLEENRSEKDVLRGLRPFRLHLTDEKLTDPVRSAVGIGEPVAEEDRIVRPWRLITRGLAEKYPLTVGGETAISIEGFGGDHPGPGEDQRSHRDWLRALLQSQTQLRARFWMFTGHRLDLSRIARLASERDSLGTTTIG